MVFKKGNKNWNSGLNKSSDERLMNMSKRMIRDNPMKKKDVREKKNKTFKERGLYEKLAEKKRGKKRPEMTGEKHPLWNKTHSKDAKIKIGNSSRERWQNKTYRNKLLVLLREGLKQKPTKPERIFIELIKENNFPLNYCGNGRVWFTGQNQSFNPDFISNKTKHIIEIFGEHWHNLPENRSRDEERIKTYSKYGYKTLIIWDYELKNMDQLIKRVLDFLEVKNG